MDHHYHARYPIIQIQGCAEKDSQALIHALAEPAKQLSVIFKEVAQDNWNTEDILAMRNRINIFVSLARADFVLLAVRLFPTIGLINFFLGGLKTSLIFILFLLYLLNYVILSKGTMIKEFSKSFLLLLIKSFFTSILRNITVNPDFFLLFILFELNLIGILIFTFLFLLEASLYLIILLGLIFNENIFLLNSSLSLGK